MQKGQAGSGCPALTREPRLLRGKFSWRSEAARRQAALPPKRRAAAFEASCEQGHYSPAGSDVSPVAAGGGSVALKSKSRRGFTGLLPGAGWWWDDTAVMGSEPWSPGATGRDLLGTPPLLVFAGAALRNGK